MKTGFRYSVLVTSFFLCRGITTLAQEGECQTLLKKVYDNYATLVEKNKSKTALFDMMVDVTQEENGKRSIQSNMITLKLSATHYFMQTSHMRVYADKEDVFTVVNNTKSIYKAPNRAKIKTDSLPMPSWADWSKQIESCTCQKVENQKEYDMEVVLRLKESQAKSAAQSMVFHVKSRQSLFHSIKVGFPEQATLKEMVITYLKTQFSNSPVFKGPYSSYFINNTTGQLQPAFKGYKLVDIKNKKSRP